MVQNHTTQLEAPPQTTSREEIVKLVRKWGDVNTDGILDTSCKIYTDPNIAGLIGYRIETGHAVVFGDPVASPSDKLLLAASFQTHCEEQNLGVVYTMVTEDFANWSSANQSGAVVEFGERFILDPQIDPAELRGSKAVLVRKKIKHAIRDGVAIHEYTNNDPNLKQQIEEVADDWLKRRRGPQVYLSRIQLFDDPYGKRWLYAIAGDKVVGLLILNELQSYQGWLLNNVMIKKDAPSGTSELLVITALHILKRENCRFTLIGPIPAKNLGIITGVSKVSSAISRFVYKCAKKVFHLDRHVMFWEKFQPAVERSYLLFPKNNLRLSSIVAILRAFNVGPS